MKVLTWNLEWARPGSRRERVISEILAASDADLICLTEAYRATLPQNGAVIEAGEGNRVADRKGARKVLLWSRHAWEMRGPLEELAPPGRLAIGTTQTPLGQLRVIGVCIPWFGSNTARYGGARQPWDDHLSFISGLRMHLRVSPDRTLLIGDFNQRLPRTRQPARTADALEAALSKLVIATTGFRSDDGDLTIDHICHSPNFEVKDLIELPKRVGGITLSDHFGVVGCIGKRLTA